LITKKRKKESLPRKKRKVGTGDSEPRKPISAANGIDILPALQSPSVARGEKKEKKKAHPVHFREKKTTTVVRLGRSLRFHPPKQIDHGRKKRNKKPTQGRQQEKKEEMGTAGTVEKGMHTIFIVDSQKRIRLCSPSKEEKRVTNLASHRRGGETNRGMLFRKKKKEAAGGNFRRERFGS